MAVNTQKLLPSAKGSPLAKISAAKIVPAISIKKKSIDTQKLLGPKKDEPGQIVKTLTDIDVRLKLLLKEEQKQQSQKRKQKEKAEFEKQEKKLEAPKEAKKFNLPKLSIPGASFLDRIKRFLFFTALGWLFTKFQDQLPKLVGVVKIITQVYGVAENIFKFLLESFVNLIDRGYQAYDKIRGLAKSIGGEKAQQEFDNLSGKLNEYINYALIGGMALTGAINAFSNEVKGRDGGRTNGVGGGGPRTQGRTPTGHRLVQRGGSSKGLSGGRYGSGQVERIAKFDPLKKNIFQRAGQASRIGAKKATQAVIGKQATRQLLRLAKGPLSRLPLLGGLIEFGLSWALGDPVGKAAFRGVGTLLLGAVGSLILPGFGTFAGGWLGAELAGKLYEVLFENKKPQGKVQKKQGGGPVTRGGKPQGGGPTRSIKITRRRPPKVKPKQSQPGKDVGGKKKIRELYPDPSVRTDIEGEQKGAWWNLLSPLPKNATPDQIQQRNDKIKSLPNSYKALTGVAKILKDIPFGIGALMGGAVDIALGQKLPNDAINNLSNGVSYLINAIANRQVSASITSIEKEIAKMQTGGAVPRLKDFKNRDEFGLGKDIGKVLDGMIRQKVDEAIREVQKQLMSGKYGTGVAPGGPGGGGGGGGGGGAGPYGAPPRLGPGGPITTVPGIVDQKGRPVRFASTAAAAFISMMEDAKKEKKPFKGSDIASTYRDPELNKAVGGAENSPHLYGLAADIHGTTGAWIRSKGKDYGWVPYDYEGTHGGHYEYIGGGKKEKPVKTLPDIFKREEKPSSGQLPPIFERPGAPQSPTQPRQQPSTQPPRPSKPPGQQPADQKSGMASFYGGPYDTYWHGRKTASGQVFDENAFSTALRDGLPFGMYEVTYNGKTVLVRGNDRGNFGPGNTAGIKDPRDLDLSYGAAKALGITIDGRGGKGSVTYRRVGDLKPSGGGIIQRQGGGLIPKQSPKDKTSSITSYPSYSEGGMRIAIRPIIVEKTIPVPIPTGGRRTTTFLVAGGVNNINPGLSRG
jgi:rare lipoprotein A (peptidoglycan hydrolase)